MSIRKTISNIEKKIDNIFSNLFKEEDCNLHKIPIYISKKKKNRNIRDIIKKKKILIFGGGGVFKNRLPFDHCGEIS